MDEVIDRQGWGVGWDGWEGMGTGGDRASNLKGREIIFGSAVMYGEIQVR